jgi:hypothetical protein
MDKNGLMEEATTDNRITGKPFWLLVALTLLINAFFSGCAVVQLQSLEALILLRANPGQIFPFLLSGLMFYSLAAFLTWAVMYAVMAVRGKRPRGDMFLVWSTALNFLLIGFAWVGAE